MSDRSTIITPDIWQKLAKILDTELNLSTTLRLETNDQSEGMFRIIQEMIGCFISHV